MHHASSRKTQQMIYFVKMYNPSCARLYRRSTKQRHQISFPKVVLDGYIFPSCSNCATLVKSATTEQLGAPWSEHWRLKVAVVCSNCRQDHNCGSYNFKLCFVEKARNCSIVRAARAARLFIRAHPIKFLICRVVIAFDVVYAKAP